MKCSHCGRDTDTIWFHNDPEADGLCNLCCDGEAGKGITKFIALLLLVGVIIFIVGIVN